jgi:uncharacterized phage protein gp47/JayE
MADDNLIPDPILDDSREEDRIAARIHRSVAGVTADSAQAVIDFGEGIKLWGQSLLDMVNASGAVSEPLLSEITSPEPAHASVRLLVNVEQAFTETHYRFNQLPDKVLVNLLRLMGVELQPAIASSCTLQFTKVADYLNQDVEVPAGVQVRTEDRQVIVSTDDDLVIPSGQMTAAVTASATTEGPVRSDANTIGVALTSLAGVASVTNTTALTGGAAAELPDQGKVRARREFSIGRHLGSVNDYETYITDNILRSGGRVTGFEGYLYDFSQAALGNALLIVQGTDGLAPAEATLAAVQGVINERHVAGLYVTARGPKFKPFDVTARVSIARGASATTLINKSKANLAAFFDPLRFEYGPAFPDRFISLSDIVGQIESASPRLISVKTVGGLFDVTFTVDGTDYMEDIHLDIGELPLLNTVTLTVA